MFIFTVVDVDEIRGMRREGRGKETARDGKRRKETARDGKRRQETARDDRRRWETRRDGIRHKETGGDGKRRQETARDGKRRHDTARDGKRRQDTTRDKRRHDTAKDSKRRLSSLSVDSVHNGNTDHCIHSARLFTGGGSGGWGYLGRDGDDGGASRVTADGRQFVGGAAVSVDGDGATLMT